MAYVFGIEGVPVFEMLFILIGLMLIGFIFILLELKKMTRLLSEESKDIQRFELDLDKLEKGNSRKPSEQMVAYIQEALNKGLSQEQIETSLEQAGWGKKQITDIFETIKK
jgi:hypothetical protein